MDAPGISGLAGAVERLAACVRDVCAVSDRAALVGISGIDGAGKSRVAAHVARGFENCGLRAATLAVDPWHEPASVRFSPIDPGGHFYRHAFRWDEMFSSLVDPLVARRERDVRVRQLRLEDDAWFERRHTFQGIDVVLLEGIFLFERSRRSRFDATLWIECPYDVALARALARNQEGLPRERLIDDYERIYFPAQRLHAALDDPARFAGLLLPNG